jgi:transposase
MSLDEAKEYLTPKEIEKAAKMSGVSISTVYNVIAGRTERSKCVGYLIQLAEARKERIKKEIQK